VLSRIGPPIRPLIADRELVRRPTAIGLQWRLNISHGRWTPWGVLLLLPAVVGVVLTLILVRLRCFGRAEPAGDGTR
jgi:hypothetical protein